MTTSHVSSTSQRNFVLPQTFLRISRLIRSHCFLIGMLRPSKDVTGVLQTFPLCVPKEPFNNTSSPNPVTRSLTIQIVSNLIRIVW